MCSRCGDFACEDCYAIGPDGSDLCVRCAATLPSPASLRHRFWGELIDVGAFTLIISSGLALRDLIAHQTIGWVFAALPVIAFTVAQLALVAQSGQSIGKKVVGVRTLRTNGRPVEVWRVLLLRNLVPLVLSIAMPGIFRTIDALFIFGREKRCVHDYMADTMVVEAGRIRP